MRIIVTGATGMIGVSFIEAAVRHGHSVLAIVRENSRNLSRLPVSDKIRVEYADLSHTEMIHGDGESYDVLVHLGWKYTFREGRYDVWGQEQNVKDSLGIVALAARMGCRRFVGAGSQAEYGPVSGMIDHNTPFNPQFPYAMAKVSAYWLTKALCEQSGLEHVWGRIFSVYGEDDHEGTLLLYAIDAFLAGKTAEFSSGTQMWNYLYKSDAAEMLLRLADSSVPQGEYFIAHPISRPLKEYLQILMAEFGDNVSAHFDERSGAGVYPDMRITMSLLGYAPKVSFEEGIRRMISFREQQKKKRFNEESLQNS